MGVQRGLSGKISTIGPAPATVKSWWIRALSTSSRIAFSGYMRTSIRNAWPIGSFWGNWELMNATAASKASASPR